MRYIIQFIFCACLLVNIGHAADLSLVEASPPDVGQEIEQLNNKLQGQLKTMQAQQQQQMSTLNSQVQTQLKKMQTELQNQIQTVNSQTQAQMKEIQKTLQDQIAQVQKQIKK